MSLFKPSDSRFFWYSFYFDGRRYRGSTKQTKKTAAAVYEASLLARLQEGNFNNFDRKKPPILVDFAKRFIHWVENSQQLEPNSKRYYLYGWRLLSFSPLAGLRLHQITKDVAESVVFMRPKLNRRKVTEEGRYETTGEMIPCSAQYTNQALRTLKVLFGKAVEWHVMREAPEVRIAYAAGRDRMLDESSEDRLDLAYHEPIKHRRTKRVREQAWLVMVIMQDTGMRPSEIFSMRIEDIHWPNNRIWIPQGKTANAARFVPISERMSTLIKGWCGARKDGWLFPSTRSKCGHLTSIAKGFQAARDRAGLDERLVPYSARHTCGTYTLDKTGNAFAVSKSMGHASLKSMQPYQHPELEPLRKIINLRNRRKRSGQVFSQVPENANT